MMHHYKGSGLDNVFVDLDTFDNEYYGPGIVIAAFVQLHDLITEEIITAPGLLTSREFRFLWTELGFTPDEFAHRLGCDSTMIARLEKGEAVIDPATDIRIRRMVAEKFAIEAVTSKTDAELRHERLLPRNESPIVIRRTTNGNDCQYWVDTATPLAELPLAQAPLADKGAFNDKMAGAGV